MPRFDKLLVLDLDETLVCALEKPLDRRPDFELYSYYVYRRPGVESFVRTCLDWFEVGIWTSSGELYADRVVQQLFPDPSRLAFVWSHYRCGWRLNIDTREQFAVKNIKKLSRKGYRREKIIFVDDSPEKLHLNYGNGVIVSEYTGQEHDRELDLLIRYLEILGPAEDVRKLEKRWWRRQIDPECK